MERQKESLPRRFWNAVLILVLLPIVLPLSLISLILYGAHRITLYILIWVLWLPKGKDILVVYSDSPIWKEYMATRVLPIVQERAIVLNWSERNTWRQWSFRVHVFHCFGGGREFNPLVVLFRPFRRARAFRFWVPFKDWKRGFTEPVEKSHQELFSVL